MLAAVIVAIYVVLAIATGRVEYAVDRYTGIKAHGLTEYEKHHEATDKLFAAAVSLMFPLTWAVALAYGAFLMLNVAITGRPYRSRLEQLEARERDIEQRERGLGMSKPPPCRAPHL